MEWVETTGRTVEEALDAALDELGVNEDEVEYEVLEQPKAGFLGRFGGVEARIRARVRPISREKPGDKRRRRRDESRRSGRSEESRPESERTRRAEGPTAAATTRVAANEGNEDADGDGDAVAETTGQPRPSGNRRRRRRRTGPGRPATVTNAEDGMSESSVPLEDQLAVASEFAEGLVQRFGLTAEVSGRVEGDDDVYVDIAGGDLGVLIGPRGATIDALQELVKTAVQHRTGGLTARMHVDVSGYRASRNDALATFARRVAETARETGRDQVLEPMNSADRKVVHDAVGDIDGVMTTSEGEDPRRRVVIRKA
jgi:spoIIIJ-associated protein